MSNHKGYKDPTADAAIGSVARYERRLMGLRSRESGKLFESMIEAGLEWYKVRGIAHIEKTPEPMKPLSRPNRQGQFLACYTKAGQPDFKGTLNGGQSVVFEAKHTEDNRIEYNRLTEEQADDLALHHALGAVAFVLVSFGLTDFFRIPWNVWRDMKIIYGRKYMTRQECEPFRVSCMAGVIKMLEGIPLKYNDESV